MPTGSGVNEPFVGLSPGSVISYLLSVRRYSPGLRDKFELFRFCCEFDLQPLSFEGELRPTEWASDEALLKF